MVFDFLKLGLNNLKRRKLRSWLTMIGIFIGIAAVVSLISLGEGLQETINEQFEKLGKDKIIIQPKGMGLPGSAVSESLILTDKDLEVIKNVRGVEWALGYLIKQGRAKFKGEIGIGFATGIKAEDFEKLIEIGNFNLFEGRILKKGDRYKVVVGYNHAYGDIWKRGIEIGEKIEIEGVDFKIIGIIEKIGNPVDDALLYIPKEKLREILDVYDEESQIMVKTISGFDTKDVAEEIERKLRKSRGEKQGQETFNVQTSEQLMETFENIFGVVQAVLVGIAAISLLVGGIGIMNTMFTSVRERVREIGIMKAIGAKNTTISTIFLLESGIIGFLGGIGGTVLGVLFAKMIEWYLQIHPIFYLKAYLSPGIIIFGLVFSFIIGCLSGFLPARSAAKLNPAEALRRYE